jgi:hypothetical protein
MTTVKTQNLSTEAQNLFIELVKINLTSFEKVNFNMLSNTIKFYSELIPFNTVSENYLITLCHNKGIKIKN